MEVLGQGLMALSSAVGSIAAAFGFIGVAGIAAGTFLVYTEKASFEEDLAKGGATSIHEAMIAAEKATLSMQMAVQVRNRILSAYTEINSMAL